MQNQDSAALAAVENGAQADQAPAPSLSGTSGDTTFGPATLASPTQPAEPRTDGAPPPAADATQNEQAAGANALAPAETGGEDGPPPGGRSTPEQVGNVRKRVEGTPSERLAREERFAVRAAAVSKQNEDRAARYVHPNHVERNGARAEKPAASADDLASYGWPKVSPHLDRRLQMLTNGQQDAQQPAAPNPAAPGRPVWPIFTTRTAPAPAPSALASQSRLQPLNRPTTPPRAAGTAPTGALVDDAPGAPGTQNEVFAAAIAKTQGRPLPKPIRRGLPPIPDDWDWKVPAPPSTTTRTAAPQPAAPSSPPSRSAHDAAPTAAAAMTAAAAASGMMAPPPGPPMKSKRPPAKSARQLTAGGAHGAPRAGNAQAPTTAPSAAQSPFVIHDEGPRAFAARRAASQSSEPPRPPSRARTPFPGLGLEAGAPQYANAGPNPPAATADGAAEDGDVDMEDMYVDEYAQSPPASPTPAPKPLTPRFSGEPDEDPQATPEERKAAAKFDDRLIDTTIKVAACGGDCLIDGMVEDGHLDGMSLQLKADYDQEFDEGEELFVARVMSIGSRRRARDLPARSTRVKLTHNVDRTICNIFPGVELQFVLAIQEPGASTEIAPNTYIVRKGTRAVKYFFINIRFWALGSLQVAFLDYKIERSFFLITIEGFNPDKEDEKKMATILQAKYRADKFISSIFNRLVPAVGAPLTDGTVATAQDVEEALEYANDAREEYLTSLCVESMDVKVKGAPTRHYNLYSNTRRLPLEQHFEVCEAMRSLPIVDGKLGAGNALKGGDIWACGRCIGTSHPPPICMSAVLDEVTAPKKAETPSTREAWEAAQSQTAAQAGPSTAGGGRQGARDREPMPFTPSAYFSEYEPTGRGGRRKYDRAHNNDRGDRGNRRGGGRGGRGSRGRGRGAFSNQG